MLSSPSWDDGEFMFMISCALLLSPPPMPRRMVKMSINSADGGGRCIMIIDNSRPTVLRSNSAEEKGRLGRGGGAVCEC